MKESKSDVKYKYIICRRNISGEWEVNDFYLPKGIAAKEAIEESAAALFASLFPGTEEEGAFGTEEEGPEDSEESDDYIEEIEEKDCHIEDAQLSYEGVPEGHPGHPGHSEETDYICAILFYDRSKKGNGFLPINIAYKDPYEEYGMLMEGCKSKFTNKFFKKLDDTILSQILSKEISCHVPPKSRKSIGMNGLRPGLRP